MLQPALEPHHDGSPLYVSSGHPELGEVVRVRVRIPRAWGDARRVLTRSNPDHEPRFTEAEIVARDDDAVWWEADLTVENPIHGYRFLIERADGTAWWLSARGLSRTEARDMNDFRLVSYPEPPEWGQSTVLYQVFPDRFARSELADRRDLPDWAEPAAWGDEVIHVGPSTATQFFGGDLDGVREKLDHLVGLGVTMIYLTPVFPARSNHRYDAWSFEEVDPLLGGDEALIRLVEAAHERGLKVIGDLTSNHSGDAHEWFRAAHGQPGAAESDFYYWLDPEQQGYVSWLGVPSLPKLNWHSRELRRRFIEGPRSIVGRWLAEPYSLDGWRIDVANMTGRYLDDDLNQEVRRIIRQTMIDVNPDTLLLGESTNDAASDFTGDAWHGAMTYANFTRPLWNWLREPGSPAPGGINVTLGRTEDFSGLEFWDQHRRFTAELAWRVRLHTMNALDTHDTPRFLTHARPGAVPVAFGLAVTLPGIPVVFAGDEFGLVGDDGEHSRTPLPWDRLAEAAGSIDLYSALIGLKRAHPALNGGGLRWLHIGDDVLVFARETADETALVAAARADVVVELAAGSLGAAVGDVERLIGEAALDIGADGAARIHSTGMSFTAWRLPGVALPAFRRPGDDAETLAGSGDVTPELAPEVF
ncbi:glycoside hydrolase family 13 protein [Schumannella soli]|uniref:Glycoside hydrolase family 13 protein n=1 Tax=Schumannella soli TaxID=2590779 RepID=A0A506Y6S5_9MICO|nr:glycoside hydrolase family 13 protein [Schumannella soli]TPW77563.1 glycoside hydrolase family 13 protein [Schumannella soli]